MNRSSLLKLKFQPDKQIPDSNGNADSRISVDDGAECDELSSNQNKRIEQIMFKELYQKTIERAINFDSSEDMEVMIAAMKKKIKGQKDKQFIISAISQIGVFANHPMIFKAESVTQQLFREIKLEYYSKRSTIFNQGDIGDTYYMIIKGGVYCLIPTSQNQAKVEDANAKKKKRWKKAVQLLTQKEAEPDQDDKMLNLNDEEFLEQKFPNFKSVKVFKNWEGFGDIALITQQYRQFLKSL